jgi:hypothetical protein
MSVDKIVFDNTSKSRYDVYYQYANNREYRKKCGVTPSEIKRALLETNNYKTRASQDYAKRASERNIFSW